jgi:hypothetical protein
MRGMLLVATDSRPRNLSCDNYSGARYDASGMGKLTASLRWRFRSVNRGLHLQVRR